MSGPAPAGSSSKPEFGEAKLDLRLIAEPFKWKCGDEALRNAEARLRAFQLPTWGGGDIGSWVVFLDFGPPQRDSLRLSVDFHSGRIVEGVHGEIGERKRAPMPAEARLAPLRAALRGISLSVADGVDEPRGMPRLNLDGEEFSWSPQFGEWVYCPRNGSCGRTRTNIPKLGELIIGTADPDQKLGSWNVRLSELRSAGTKSR